VIERHSAATYHVYMLGFLPGMAYLGDVPAELVLPRRWKPRLAGTSLDDRQSRFSSGGHIQPRCLPPATR